MKMLWCWRCKTEMPMLDDDEFRQVMSLLPTLDIVEDRNSLQTQFAPMLAGVRTNYRIPGNESQCRVPSLPLRIWGSLSALWQTIGDSAGEALRLLHEVCR